MAASDWDGIDVGLVCRAEYDAAVKILDETKGYLADLNKLRRTNDNMKRIEARTDFRAMRRYAIRVADAWENGERY